MSKRSRATRPSTMPTVRSPPVPADGDESWVAEDFESMVRLGDEEVAWARKRAASSGQTLAAVVTEALRRFRHSEAQLELDEMDVEGVTAEDVAAIRAARRSYRP